MTDDEFLAKIRRRVRRAGRGISSRNIGTEPRIRAEDKIRLKGRAKLNLAPVAVLEGYRCDGAIYENDVSAITVMELSEVPPYVVVPVNQKTRGAHLKQCTDVNWNRRLPTSNERESQVVLAPLWLSARRNWHVDKNRIEVFDRACVLDGAKRLEAVLRSSAIGKARRIPVIVVFGLSETEECKLRERLQGQAEAETTTVTKERIDTATPRLQIHSQWVEVNVLSDPFVVPNRYGYVPAIVVKRDGATQREHVLLGAKSLALELEELRLKHGSLVGLTLAITKETAERTSRYLVECRSA